MLNQVPIIFHVSCCVIVLVFQHIYCFPQGEFRMRISTRQSEADTLSLPSNATSIREDITDNFSCENKTYGYYADVDNDCQIFHVCMPVTYASGKNQTFRWSFICPETTVFSQENLVCVREEDLNIKCEDSADFYEVNDNFGDKEQEEDNVSMPEDNMNEEDSNQGEMDAPNDDSMGKGSDMGADRKESSQEEINTNLKIKQ